VASGLALGAVVVVAGAEPAASLLMSDQLPEFASRTSAQWSSGVAVANAVAELPPPRVPVALAEHASHLCALFSDICRNHTHIRSDSAIFHHKKRYTKIFIALIILTNNFSDKEESGNKLITQLNN
jgi:hypothetical protein